MATSQLLWKGAAVAVLILAGIPRLIIHAGDARLQFSRTIEAESFAVR